MVSHNTNHITVISRNTNHITVVSCNMQKNKNKKNNEETKATFPVDAGEEVKLDGEEVKIVCMKSTLGLEPALTH